MTKVYLAGKIEKNCWRHKIVPGLRGTDFGRLTTSYLEAETEYMREHGVSQKIEYTGPFFRSCDHGCGHGKNTHGVGVGIDRDCSDEDFPKPLEVAGENMKGIQECDVLFAWIDSIDCYGTLMEIGYALGLGKRVIITIDQELSTVNDQDLWFVKACCMRESGHTGFEEYYPNATAAFEAHFI